jgi:hypothetical protein
MAEEMVRTPEAGRRLGIDTREVYDLIFSGQLDGKPNAEGLVVIAASEIERYRLAHAGA